MNKKTPTTPDQANSKCDKPAEATLETIAVSAPTPLEPVDLTQFALTEDFHSGATQKVLSVVPVRKPQKEAFVRTHPDPECWQLYGLLEMEEAGKIYLLTPAVAAALRDEGESTLFHAHLVLTVDRRGNPFLWPLKVSDRENTWHVSARCAAEAAKENWIRVASNMAARHYDVLVATNQDAAPVWPAESYGDVLNIAFKGNIIADMEHEVIQELRGQF